MSYENARMFPHGVVTVLCCCLLAIPESTLSSEHDFRYISYQDLQLSLDRFSQPGTTTYSQMLFDVSRNQIFLGARDVLYRLSLHKLELLEAASWPASVEKVTQCVNKGQSEENCHNYIKVLLTNGKQLFACGTNGFSPQCTWRKIESISEVTQSVMGVAKCPYDPSANITGYMTENGEYYFGGPTDFSGSLSLITKETNGNTISTKQYDNFWLNEPQFVGSFETDRFVYFMFREAAVEYINCGKIVYSRIARVCKNDAGGSSMLKDNWTTFLKARLNCSISGDYPFYFNEIQSMSYVPDEGLLYATFTTPPNSIAGSAICAFNLTAINAAFNGPFKHQDHIGSAWGKQNMQHRDHYECKSSLQNNHLIETAKYQLMDFAVQSSTLNPLHVAESERFTHITVDVLATKLHRAVHVIYASTTEGLVKKITVLPRTQETCVVEVWQTTPDSRMSIRNMQFLKETNSVYLTSDLGLLKISADHCGRHFSKESCINAMDPYCGWNERNESCSVSPNNDPLDKSWKQDGTSCPVLDAPVDGGWSSWSEWAPCMHRTSGDPDSAADNCLCQTRQCNNPAPANGGRKCSTAAGFSIAVINCTVHGGWSDWSQWSACSATCGTAVKTRSRTCTNPAPSHGGRVCVGQDRTEAFCAEVPPCPSNPQDGGWGRWGDWSPCSVTCGAAGYRKRERYCDSPPPRNGGQECVGDSLQISNCTAVECDTFEQHSRASPLFKNKTWYTEWIEDSTSSSSRRRTNLKKRYKMTCKAHTKQSHLKVSISEEVEYCSDPICPEERDKSSNSNYSPWTECSVPCGGGTQNRTRICHGENCSAGKTIQMRKCNTHTCTDEWGCWSEWSPCNVSCGWGVKTRYRTCLSHSCKGPEREEMPCENQPCDSLLGWGNWSSWSLCDKNNLQYRKRKCHTSHPSPNICRGAPVENRMCFPPDMANDMSPLTVQAEPPADYTRIVVACLSTGFIFGFLMGVGMMWLFNRYRKKQVAIPGSPHYITKPNPYSALPLSEGRAFKKQNASSSNNFLNNLHNGTLKSMKHSSGDSGDTATLKRNSNGLHNGHAKQEMFNDDKFLYE